MIALPLRIAATVAVGALWWAPCFALDPDPPDTAVNPQPVPGDALPEVAVLGTRIVGSDAAEALPVTSLSAQRIETTGAVSGDDLLRSLPFMGDVAFNPANSPQTSNAPRGDVASIDLRGAGLGETLVLLNGHRMVDYPTSQTTGGVPLISFNAQTLPVAALDHLDILRDGAGAIYGSDAVAGVLNAVTVTHFNGLTISNEYGGAEHTSMRQENVDLLAGHDFAGGAGNITVAVDLAQRSAELSGDEPYTATQDLRSLFADQPGYASSSAPDNRSNQSSWPALVALGIHSPVMQGPVSLTTAAGSFHIQPATLPGCLTALGGGLCIGSGPVPYTTTANALRYDAARNDSTTDTPAIHRQIVELNASYELSPAVTPYSEFDYYHATSLSLTTDGTTLVPMGIPASNYYNPFGPVTFADGTPNPNRVSGLTNVPAVGLPLTFATYRFNDLGPDPVDVDSYQSRVLLGVRGTLFGFSWDSALLYGAAQARDTSTSISSQALAQQLALSTPDAYNPFNGSCLNGAGGGDCTPSSAAALKAIAFRLQRLSQSTLTDADFKLADPNMASLPAGDLGVASGIEARRETETDIRDPSVNGSEPFTDPVTGLVSTSSAVGVSSTPDTSGTRVVYSSYLELAVPVLSSGMGVPLTRAVNLQLAGRYEHYSDFGSVTRPKVAIAWDLAEGLALRGSYDRGFAAPNLEATAPVTFASAAGVKDYYRCEADLLTHRIASFGACTDSVTASYDEYGNPDLKPESSTSDSFGIVLKPPMLQSAVSTFSLSVDRWQLRESNIVDDLGTQNLSVLDYLNRIQGGSGYPGVVRSAPNADDIAEFSGSGLTPVGAITQINDRFENLDLRRLAGIDYSIHWEQRAPQVGLLDVGLDVATLDKLYQSLSAPALTLFSARSADIINAATPLTDAANQLEVMGNPRVKGLLTARWELNPVQVGASVKYTGRTLDTGLLSTTGVPWRVASLTTIDLYGEYSLRGILNGADFHWRVGVRNLLDRSPPLESDGYNAALYVPYGRYLYTRIGAAF